MNAIISVMVILTVTVLSATDKKKVRTIARAGLELPVTINREDFEALYLKAMSMPVVVNTHIYVRKNRAKKNTCVFSIEENVVVEDIPEVSIDTDDDVKVVLTSDVSEEETTQKTTKSRFDVANEMLNLFGNANGFSFTAPQAIPEAVDVITQIPVETPKTEEKAPVVNKQDDDYAFISYVREKALSGKYAKWTQNVSPQNLKLWAESTSDSVESVISRYLIPHVNSKNGRVNYYTVRPEFIAKFYSKACYASIDRMWLVVVKGDMVELYKSIDGKNVLQKTVEAATDPNGYAKAIKVLEGYTFREGQWACNAEG